MKLLVSRVFVLYFWYKALKELINFFSSMLYTFQLDLNEPTVDVSGRFLTVTL